MIGLVPAGADRSALPLLAARALRAFTDGYVAVLLPAYLLALGLDVVEGVGAGDEDDDDSQGQNELEAQTPPKRSHSTVGHEADILCPSL